MIPEEINCGAKEIVSVMKRMVAGFSYPQWPTLPEKGEMKIVDESHPNYKIVLLDERPSIVFVRNDKTYFCDKGTAVPIASRNTIAKILEAVHALKKALPCPYSDDTKVAKAWTQRNIPKQRLDKYKGKYDGWIIWDTLYDTKTTISFETSLKAWAKENGFEYQTIYNAFSSHHKRQGLRKQVGRIRVIPPPYKSSP